MLHGGIIGSEEAKEQKHHVGILKHFHAGNLGGTRLDMAIVIQTKEHGALEAVAMGQNTGNRRACFLAAVFVVTGNEYNVLALADSRLSLISEGLGLKQRREATQGATGHQEVKDRFHQDVVLRV
jgi:hypothetical protein